MLKNWGRRAMVVALAASTTLVAACATETTYRPATGSGFYRTGYSDTQIEPNRFRVTFAGNTVTDRDVVERYLLFRAAELTLQNGYDYFVMADRDTDRQARTYSTPGAWGPGFGGWGGGADIRTIDRYEASAEIVMFKGTPERGNVRAFNARAVVDSIGPTVKLPRP